MPFSDPMADGPAIQAAGQRALKRGMTLAQDAGDGAPPARARPGHALRDDGLLQPDLPLRRRGVRARCCRRRPGRRDHRRSAARGGRGTGRSRRAPPGSISCGSPPRPATRRGCRRSSRKPAVFSITSRSPASPAPARPRPRACTQAVARLRRFTDLPIAVGFGVKNPQQAAEVAKAADAAVVGSALVDRIAAQPRPRRQRQARPRRSRARRHPRPRGRRALGGRSSCARTGLLVNDLSCRSWLRRATASGMARARASASAKVRLAS